MTRVVNLYKHPYDVYIGRPGKGQTSEWGNPFRLNPNESRTATIERYEAYMRQRLANEPDLAQKLLELKGKTLGCFCKPHPCHGDVLVKLIEELS